MLDYTPVVRDDGFFYYNGPELANSEYAHLKFTYEFHFLVFLDTVIYKGKIFKNEHTPDIIFFLFKPSNFFTWKARILVVSLKLLLKEKSYDVREILTASRILKIKTQPLKND